MVVAARSVFMAANFDGGHTALFKCGGGIFQNCIPASQRRDERREEIDAGETLFPGYAWKILAMNTSIFSLGKSAAKPAAHLPAALLPMLVLATAGAAFAQEITKEQSEFFESKIRPVLADT